MANKITLNEQIRAYIGREDIAQYGLTDFGLWEVTSGIGSYYPINTERISIGFYSGRYIDVVAQAIEWMQLESDLTRDIADPRSGYIFKVSPIKVPVNASLDGFV